MRRRKYKTIDWRMTSMTSELSMKWQWHDWQLKTMAPFIYRPRGQTYYTSMHVHNNRKHIRWHTSQRRSQNAKTWGTANDMYTYVHGRGWSIPQTPAQNADRIQFKAWLVHRNCRNSAPKISWLTRTRWPKTRTLAVRYTPHQKRESTFFQTVT